MTSEEFEHWIEDTEGSVCLECGKGGVKVDPDTGLCPRCAVREVLAQKTLEAMLDTLSFPGDWPEDRAHENGNYFCKCAACGAMFRGHKRRPVCKLCAGPPVATADTID